MSDPDPVGSVDPDSSGLRDHSSRHAGHRRDVWGDDPEEIRASEVVGEFAEDTSVQRHWHDHPAWAPFKVVWRFLRTSGKRIAITIIGFVVVAAGVVMLVVPGPGLLVIVAGLAILATEYVWAQRLLAKAKEKAEQAKNAVLRKKDDEPADGPPQESEADGGGLP